MLIGLTPAQKIVLSLSVALIVAAAVLSGASRLRSPAPVDDQLGYEPPTAADTTIRVHVVGAVYRPGLYRLPGGSRAQDAIQAAGGMTPQARGDSVNLATLLEDGQQLFVQEMPVPSPAPPATAVPSESTPKEPAAGPAGTSAVPSERTPGVTPRPASAPSTSPVPTPAPVSPPRPIAINSATLAELEQLPGVGEKLGREILYYRALNGPFHSFEELKQVPGIGDATVAKIRTAATLN